MSDFTHALATTPGQARVDRSRRGARQPLRGSGLAARAGARSGRSGARRTDRLQCGPGHAGRRRGRPLRRLRQDPGRRDPAGRRRYRPGVRPDARARSTRETQGALAAVERLQAWRSILTSSNAPPTRLLRRPRRRRRPSAGPYPACPAADAYAAALERDTIAGYREFLAAYPHSDQARRVRAILAVRREAAYLAPRRRRRHAARVLDLFAGLSERPACRRRAPPPRDAVGRVRAAAGFPAGGFRRSSSAAARTSAFYDERPIYAFDDFGPPPPPPPARIRLCRGRRLARPAAASAAAADWRASGAGNCASDRRRRGRVPRAFPP